MMELLFLFGALGWLLGTAWEYLCSLAAFPTIAAGLVAVPILTCADYLTTLQRYELDGMQSHRPPVPPERFYWTLHRRRMWFAMGWSGPVALAAWFAALRWPATAALDAASVAGWLTGAVAIIAVSRFIATVIVYVRASQWFDRMAPWAIGFSRRALYRLSENPDFLAPENPRKQEKDKSVY